MARAILAIATILWLVSGAAGLALAAFGVESLESALPPLAIDTDALRGTVTAVAVALLTLGAAHIGVLTGLHRRLRWSQTAGILLAAVLTALCGVLGVAAATSAAVTPSSAPILLGAAAAAFVAALGYGVVTARLVGARRAGTVV